MESKKLLIPFIMALVLLSCGTKPKSDTLQDVTVTVVDSGNSVDSVDEEIRVEIEVGGQVTSVVLENFDPEHVNQDYYILVRDDIRNFIEELNLIIRNRNYTAWKNSLSPEYFAQISSAENLRQASESPAMKTRRIVIRSPEEYFIYVVVPSRSNSRVDDIEFISRNRVKVFTITKTRTGEEQRLRLYDLERIGNMWKIIN